MQKQFLLHQLLAKEGDISGTANKALLDVIKAFRATANISNSESGDRYSGHNKTFKPYSDDPTEHRPDQNKPVTATIGKEYEYLRPLLVDKLNLKASKEQSNTKAFADVIVDGKEICKNLSVTAILALENEVEEIIKMLQETPTLDPTKEWKYDTNSGLYKTGITETQSTKKTKVPIVLAPATEKFAAQAQLIDAEVPVGIWNSINMSGKIPTTLKSKILLKATSLLTALKFAKSEANKVEVEEVKIGSSMLDFIFEDVDNEFK